MDDSINAITWEAPSHAYSEKKADWYWAVAIISLCAIAASIYLNNLLIALLIFFGALTLTLVASQEPPVLPYAVTTRGIRVGNELYPYTTLESFCIDESHPAWPQLLIKSERLLSPLIVLPLPDEYIDDIDTLISSRLQEEHLEEPLSHRLLEILGF